MKTTRSRRLARRGVYLPLRYSGMLTLRGAQTHGARLRVGLGGVRVYLLVLALVTRRADTGGKKVVVMVVVRGVGGVGIEETKESYCK